LEIGDDSAPKQDNRALRFHLVLLPHSLPSIFAVLVCRGSLASFFYVALLSCSLPQWSSAVVLCHRCFTFVLVRFVKPTRFSFYTMLLFERPHADEQGYENIPGYKNTLESTESTESLSAYLDRNTERNRSQSSRLLLTCLLCSYLPASLQSSQSTVVRKLSI
jgi:hypothetical protein